MRLAGNKRPFIYLAIITLLVCVTGLLFLSRWLWSSIPPASDLAFITITPGPINLNQTPDISSCGRAPAAWRSYIVQSGDTLSELSAQFQVSQPRILQANCLTSEDLQAGQQLYLPPLPTPTPCPFSPPANWTLYTIQAGDTLSDLAVARGATIDEIIRLNCLSSANIIEGEQVYLPPLPTPTPCTPNPPSDWGGYMVQDGDTIFSLAAARSTTVEAIRQINCLPSPDTIAIGQQLYLPLLPTPTPTEPPTLTPSPIALAALPTPLPPSTLNFPPPTSAPPPTLVPPPDLTIPVPPPPVTPAPPTPPPLPLLIPGDPGITDTLELKELKHEPCKGFVQRRFDTFTWSMELGERTYFFACNFTNPISATITRNDGVIEPAKLYYPASDMTPNPYLMLTGTVAAIIEWSALPTLTITKEEVYELTVIDRNPNGETPISEIFFVSPPTRPHILITPQTGSPGAAFMIYYVNFTPTTTINFDIYRAGQPWQEGDEKIRHNLPYWRSMPITIDRLLPPGSSYGGWTQSSLVLPLTESPGIYAIGYDLEPRRQPDWLFWVR